MNNLDELIRKMFASSEARSSLAIAAGKAIRDRGRRLCEHNEYPDECRDPECVARAVMES